MADTMQTPRTDAEEKYTVRIASISADRTTPDYIPCVSEAFARQLERELNEALAENARLLGKIQRLRESRVEIQRQAREDCIAYDAIIESIRNGGQI